ncbi:50S ribosomal protein L11 methyltransferase [Anaerocolumna xylanovorans]|uniref:Ribosomal protein L11 methyltransferase n=1 Tax=Anaerocolumna xylanovorans DSM 12503 TaxID=1121345 RepID=A0A1M7YMZ0_9FIRM|nr:50S ribosomal protein L11 methyltransferase [Anaerocolumna xylanovorans]SHO53994.1 ribosomal protein L11 methyltransferase [Anaerocolumna xylanovorans DSM 12503]
MKWVKLTLKTVTEAVELVSDMLMDLGIEGLEIKDNVPITERERKELFIDILPELDTDNKEAFISFYLEEGDNAKEVIRSVKEGLSELSQFVDTGSGEIEISETEDTDWINNWKTYFKPFRLDDNIVIKPTWEELNDKKDGDIVIELDPGTAFGTGSHETTKLCILALKKYLTPGMEVLDVGSGSGILSIIASRLGAKKVLGTDIDPHAVETSIENRAVNKISEEKVAFLSGDIISDDNLKETVGFEKYDIVVANILADIIIPLSGKIGMHLKYGGLFISSGIINMKKEQVLTAVKANGFEVLAVEEMGDWVSIIAKHPFAEGL